jgi:hypothetical protein
MATTIAVTEARAEAEQAAWEEYRHAVVDAPAATYDEVESWAYGRLVRRLARVGIYYPEGVENAADS